MLIRADFAAAAAAEVLAPVGVHGLNPSGTKRRQGVGSCVGRGGDDDEEEESEQHLQRGHKGAADCNSRSPSKTVHDHTWG